MAFGDKGPTTSSTKWTVELEVGLFHALHEHKPVGVNRHFKMMLIHHKLNSTIDKKILVEDIWSHLTTLYDLQALHESERLPFPNAETEFSLPDSDIYSDLKEIKYPRYVSIAQASAEADSQSDEHNEDGNSRGTTNLASACKGSGDANIVMNTDQPSKHSRSESECSGTDRNVDNKYSSERSSEKSDQRKRTRQSAMGVQSVSSSPSVVASPAPTEVVTPSTVTKRSRRI